MARTWFAGSPTAPIVPPSRDAMTKTGGDPAPSNEDISSRNKIAVHDFATAHPITPTKATNSTSDSDRPVTWTTPFASPQKELDTQPTAKETIDASANLARLIQQHSKPKDAQTAAATSNSKGPINSIPAGTVDTFAPSPSTPSRAPTAQMLPLPSNAAGTTTPAAAIPNPVASTPSLSGPGPSTMNASNRQAYFSVTAPTSLSSSFIPSISTPLTASLEKYAPKESAPRTTTPKITLRPAPATAPSAFKDTALAAHVQNTKLLSPVKPQTNGVKKRQYIKKKRSPLQSLSTSEPVPEEKRGPGRPRTRVAEEQPHQQSKQHRQPTQSCTSSPQSFNSQNFNSNQISTFPSTVSTLPSQQQKVLPLTSNSALTPSLCSEEPRLWPLHGDYVASLRHFNAKPETIHSEPIHACANHTAHQDSPGPHGHGVCTTCRHCAFRHVRATRPDLFLSAWWPLCKTCSDWRMLRIEPSQKGCSCYKPWLCFSCLMEVVEKLNARNGVEAQIRRRILVGQGTAETISSVSIESQFIRSSAEHEGTVEDVGTVMTGWACECGREIGPDAALMKCLGCQGILNGKLDPREAAAREKCFRKTALAWT